MNNKIIIVNVSKVKGFNDEEEIFVVTYQSNSNKFLLLSRTNCFFSWKDCEKILKDFFVVDSMFDCFDYNQYHVSITTMDEV